MADPNRCRKSVSDHTGFHFFQCKRKATNNGYCGQHDPAGGFQQTIKAKRAARHAAYERASTARYDAGWNDALEVAAREAERTAGACDALGIPDVVSCAGLRRAIASDIRGMKKEGAPADGPG